MQIFEALERNRAWRVFRHAKAVGDILSYFGLLGWIVSGAAIAAGATVTWIAVLPIWGKIIVGLLTILLVLLSAAVLSILRSRSSSGEDHADVPRKGGRINNILSGFAVVAALILAAVMSTKQHTAVTSILTSPTPNRVAQQPISVPSPKAAQTPEATGRLNGAKAAKAPTATKSRVADPQQHPKDSIKGPATDSVSNSQHEFIPCSAIQSDCIIGPVHPRSMAPGAIINNAYITNGTISGNTVTTDGPAFLVNGGTIDRTEINKNNISIQSNPPPVTGVTAQLGGGQTAGIINNGAPKLFLLSYTEERIAAQYLHSYPGRVRLILPNRFAGMPDGTTTTIGDQISRILDGWSIEGVYIDNPSGDGITLIGEKNNRTVETVIRAFDAVHLPYTITPTGYTGPPSVGKPSDLTITVPHIVLH